MGDILNFKDNTRDNEFDTQHLETLKKYSHTKLEDLSKSNPELFIFPPKIEDNDFYKTDLWTVNNNTVRTYNIMGFIGLGDCSVKISSRFTKDKEQDFFLHYMLQKVFLGQVIDFPLNTDETNIWDFLYYLFPDHLKKALNIGLYKEYVRKQYNDANIRGAIDVKRHIKSNIPFQYKVAYNVREHSYNNKITQLIRHTIEFISRHRFGNSILNSSWEIKESIEQIKHITPNFSMNHRQFIIKECSQPILNPYWKDYENLRKLCLKILKQEGLSFNGTKDKVHGILFDGAWLWEEYLNTFLSKEGFTHPDNKKGTDPCYLFKDEKEKIFPDFYSTDKSIVIDAKYKYIDSKNNDDYYQLITYMYILKSKIGMLMYPCENSTCEKHDLNGYVGKFIKMTHKISSENSEYSSFCKQMEDSETQTLQKITKYHS